MTDSISPIKRTTFLAPLSREHHETLLFTWKINQGLHYKISVDRILAFCNAYFEHHMKDHFAKEEEELAKVLPQNHLMMERMISDHESIKTLMHKLESNATEVLLAELAQVVKDHVRFEERQLFNYVEEIATIEQLQMLGSVLIPNEAKPMEWKDEFWVVKK